MRIAAAAHVLRCVLSAAFSTVLVLGATHLRHVNHTPVALALVLLILTLAIRWGWLEALIASLAGGVAFDYFFLPPHGFALEAPEHLISLVAFLLTAITTGQLAARANRHRRDAERRRDEIDRLYRFGNALLESETAESVLPRVPGLVASIFGAPEVAFCDVASDAVIRSGTSATLDEGVLRRVASGGRPLFDPARGLSAVPIPGGGAAIAVAGASLSRRELEGLAERVAVALARSAAAREKVAAEVEKRAQSLKSAVLDALAHEIKGPLATVKVSATTLLSARPGSLEQQRELLSIIDEETDRIGRWIDQAVQVSRREASELVLHRASHSIRDAVNGAVAALGALAAGREIETRAPDSIPEAVFDAEMIERALLLLLDNAARYSPAGSPITVSAEFTGAEIVVGVRDRGPGVPEPERERIFEPYYRGPDHPGVPGTGLGLPSAKRIVEAHGGEIWVASAPGGGAVFFFSLPVHVSESDERLASAERRR